MTTVLSGDAAPAEHSFGTLPEIINVDDHVVEPPHTWQRWLPEKFRDRGPRVERRRIGGMRHIGGGAYKQTFSDEGSDADCWVYEDLVYIHKRHVAAVGFSRDEMTMTPITYDEMRPGCYDPKARVEDMLANWVDGSLCFPTFPRFCGQTFAEAKDKELALACVRAYNDFMVDEWCGDPGGVLIPLCIVPLWDAQLAAAEIRRNAARGSGIVIDEQKCKGCELCVAACPPRVLVMSREVNEMGYWYPLLNEGCTGCTACSWSARTLCSRRTA